MLLGRSIVHITLNALFPPACLACNVLLETPAVSSYNDPDHPTLCEACFSTVPLVMPLPRGAEVAETEKYLIGGAASYDDPVVKALIQGLKFQGIRTAAVPLGFFVARYLSLCGLTHDRHMALVPIPLGARRLRERGFNQAERIARQVSSRTGLPVRADLLIRSRHTPPQTTLTGKQARLINIEGCFSLAADLPREYTSILLLDDVTTSGATFDEAARTLRTSFTDTIVCIAAAQA